MYRAVSLLIALGFLCFMSPVEASIDSTKVSARIDSFESLAKRNFETGNFKDSKQLYDTAISLAKHEKNWESVVRSFTYKHVIALSTSNLKDAESTMDSASLYATKYLGKSSLARYKLLGLEGYNAFANTNYTRGIEVLEEAIEGVKRLESDPTDVNYSVKNLVYCYKLKGDFEEAVEIAEEHIKHLEKFGTAHNAFALDLLQMKGHILDDMGNTAASVATLNETLDRLKTLDSKSARSLAQHEILGRLSKIYFNAGETEKALKTINDAIKVSGKPIGEQTNYVLDQKIKILLEFDKIDEAEDLARTNLENSKLNKFTSEKVRAMDYSTLAYINQIQEQLDSAQFNFDQASALINLPISQNFNTYEDYQTVPDFNINTVRILSRMAAFEFKKFELEGNPEYRNNAFLRYRQAFRGSKFLQKELQSKSAKVQLNKMSQEHFSNYLDILLDKYQESPDNEIYAEIFQLIEDNKSILLKEDVYEKNLKLKSLLDQDILNSERIIQEKINAINRNIKFHRAEEGEEIVKNWKSELHELGNQQKRLNQQIERKYPDFYKSKYTLLNVEIDKIRNNLGVTDIYLNFYRSDNKLICAWLTKTDYGLHILDDIIEMEQQTSELIEMLRNDPSKGFTGKQWTLFKENSYSLYKQLLPVSTIDQFGIQHLIISPTQQLNYLPFEVLCKSQNEKANSFKSLDYLIKHNSVEYALSSELWNIAQSSKQSDVNSIVSYAPFVSDNMQKSQQRGAQENMKLECSETEVDKIAQLYAHQPVKGDNASIKRFKELSSNNIIHLATHAYIEEDAPELSRLEFYDGHVAIQDLENMQLDADLVVLSACNTGTGVLQSGEGVMHLGKGFISAGVPSLVNTLWSINDCATEKVVTQFYGQIEESNLSQALQKAKIKYLEGADKLTAHPYYWSGLIFSGNKEVFMQSRSSNLYIIFGLVSLLILGLLLFRKHRS